MYYSHLVCNCRKRRARLYDKVLQIPCFLLRVTGLRIGADDCRVRIPRERFEHFTQSGRVFAQRQTVDTGSNRLDI